MKSAIKNRWNYIVAISVALLLLTVFSIFYSSTITNEMNRVAEAPMHQVLDGQ